MTVESLNEKLQAFDLYGLPRNGRHTLHFLSLAWQGWFPQKSTTSVQLSQSKPERNLYESCSWRIVEKFGQELCTGQKQSCCSWGNLGNIQNRTILHFEAEVSSWHLYCSLMQPEKPRVLQGCIRIESAKFYSFFVKNLLNVSEEISTLVLPNLHSVWASH